MRCSHGINIKNHRCDACAEIADAEARLPHDAARTAPRVAGRRAPAKPAPVADPPNDLEYGHCEGGLRIDKLDLDQELIGQPGAFAKVAESYARACSVRDGMRDLLKSLEARRAVEYRRTADSEGGGRLTEKAIEQKLQLDPDREALFKDYLTATFEADRWDGLKEAYRQRSSMLRDLASLYIANYYTGQAVRGAAPDAYRDAAAERVRADLAQRRAAARPPERRR